MVPFDFQYPEGVDYDEWIKFKEDYIAMKKN